MKYRIKSNGIKYIVQYKYKYWPFWLTYEQYFAGEYFDTKQEAVDLVNDLKRLDKAYAGPWEVL